MATNRNTRLVTEPAPKAQKEVKGAGVLTVETTDGFVPNQPMTEVMPGTHMGTFQAIAEGDQAITANYMGATKVTSITVKPIPSKLVSAEFTGGEGFVYQNETAEVLLTFDKPLAGDQMPTYRTNPNLLIATKLVVAEDKRSGTFTVMGVNPGEGKIFAALGGVDKDATITVKEAPAVLTRIVTTPNPVFEGSNVEVRLLHDKTPNKDLINIDVDPSFAIQGDIAIEGNDAVAVYKTSTFGDYAVEATSHKVTKTAQVQVNKVMPKVTQIDVPESNLEGSEFTVTVTFDKDQYLDAADVEIVLPRDSGVTIVEAPKVVGTTVVGTYKGTKAFSGAIVVKYLSVSAGTKQFAVRAMARVASATFEPTSIVMDGKATLTVEFDKAFEADQTPLVAEVNSYLTKSKEFALNPNSMGGTLEVTGIKEGLGTITLTLAGVETRVNLAVGSKPPVLENAQLTKSDIRVGETTSLTLTFNKIEKAENVQVEVPASVELVDEPIVSDVNITYKVKGKTVSETANITVKHLVDGVAVEDETKHVAVTVVADAKAVSLTGNQAPEYKSEVEITFTADKAMVEGQAEPVFTIPEEDFTTTKEFAWDDGNTTGKLTVKVLKFSGTQTIGVTYGNVEKTIEISPVKATDLTINEVDIDYPSLEVGEVATLVVTTNKAIAEVSDIPVSVNEFLTYNNDASIESDTTLKITVTGKGAGAGVVTYNPNGGTKTQNVTVTAPAVLQSTEAAFTEVLLNTPVKCLAKFDTAPKKEKLSVTPNQESACSVEIGNVSGNNIEFTVTMKQAIVCNLTVGYGDTTKPLAITGFDGPNPTSEITCSDADKNVLLNTNFDLTLEFDQAPNAEKLSVVLPEGVENVTPVAVSETTKLKGTYKITTEGAKTIKFTYLGVEKTVEVAGTNPVTATGIELTPATDLQPGDEFTAKITFSAAMPADQALTLTVEGTEGITEVDSLVVDQSKTFATQKFKVNPDATSEQMITFDGIEGDNTTSFTPVAKAILQSVALDPAEAINIGDNVKVTYTFDKAPRLDEVVLTHDEEKLTIQGSASIESKTVVVNYTAVAEGSAEVKAVHNGIEKSTNVSIVVPVVMGELSVDPQTAQAGSETPITVTIPFTSGTPQQEKITVEVDEKFQTPVGEVSLSGMSATCVVKPHATNNGTGTITVKYDNKETKTITVEITSA